MDKIKELNLNIELIQGTADSLPFDDEQFNIVIVGFCLYWVDRKYIMKSICEIDRVLKTGGYIFLEDFDTKIPRMRINKHNTDMYTYKMNYADLFLANPQYYLCSKEYFSHGKNKFDADVQERISAQILYKDTILNSYISD